MKPSVWESTLEEFRKQVGSRRPVPASGSVSAVAASLSLHLLVKVLEITAHKKGFEADPEKLKTVIEAAKAESALLERYADEDVAAFNAYLESAKLPQSNEGERRRRDQAIASAQRQVIEGPFLAAQSAARGLGLCGGALALIPKSMVADLGAAGSLLAGAARGLIVSAESNIHQMATDQNAYPQAAAQIEELRRSVMEQARSIGRQVAALIVGKEA